MTALLLWGSFAAVAAGQEPPVAERAEGLRAAAQHTDVYLNDSFEADEWIGKAVRQAERGDWAAACTHLRRVIQEHADKLSRAADGRYVSVVDRVNDMVAAWPAEGLTVYRRQVGPEAREQFLQARREGRIGRLLSVADRYFCTTSGAEATDLAGRMALEAGHFALAGRAFERLLRDHPDRQRLAESAQGRLALVHACRGDREAARQMIALAGDDAVLEWMGQSRRLADLVESLVGEFRPATSADEGFCWPTFGGDARRNRRTSFKVDRPLAVLWRADGIGQVADVPEDELSTSFRRAVEKGRFLEMNPVIARDLVFVQDAQHVWALHFNSGTPAWRYAGLATATDQFLAADSELPRWYGLTVADGRVYACLGREVIPYYGYEAAENASALVCLDAASGDEVWRAERAGLASSDDEIEFESSPIVSGGQVYVVARRKRAFGFQDCFLYRLDASTGEVLGRTHLGSASTGGFGYRRPTLTTPSLHEDIVYVTTNLGAVASVDGYTGRVRWLRLYDRISEGRWRREGRGDTRELSPWQYNATVCTGQRLLTLPTDADVMLVLNCDTGDVMHAVRIAELADVQTLLGAEDNLVYGVGTKAFCYDLEAGAMVWEASLPGGAEVLGRGTLTAEQLLVPTRAALYAFDRSGKLVTTQPWEIPEDAGNLLAGPGVLLVTGNDRVTAYARKQEVLQRLRQRMADSPQAPAAALDLSEVLFRTGDTVQAVEVLDQAIERAGGFARSIEPVIRKRIFENCLSFANSLEQGTRPDFELVDRMYERASQCPEDTPDHLTYRLQWAEMLERAERWAEAVALYQQIVSDRTLREARIRWGEEQANAAGQLAERRIGRLIDERGTAVYARFEKQAAALVAAGRAAGDLELLARAVEAYPNARAAAVALRARGELLRERGMPVEAAQSFYAALFRFPGEADAPDLLRLIADCYADAGRPEVAWRWLTKAAREHPSATVRLDGRSVTFSEYRDYLGDVRDRVEPARPRISLPLVAQSKERPDAFVEPAWLLVPLFTDEPGTSWQRFVVYTGQALRAYETATGAEVWDEPAACRDRPDLVLATPSRVVLATRYEVFALDAATGALVWQRGKRPGRVDDPDAEPEDFASFVGLAVEGGRLLAAREDGYVACAEIESGASVWERTLDHHPFGPMALNAEWVAYQSLRFGEPLYCVLHADSGKIAQVIEPGDGRQAEHLLFSLEGNLIAVTSQTVQCYIPATGRRLWQIELGEGLATGTVRLDVDGLYLSDDGQHIEKLRLSDGRPIWQSELPAGRERRGLDNMTLDLQGGQVVVSTERSVYALSAVDGRILWEGMVRRGVRFRHRFITEAFFVGIDAPPEHFEDQHTAYFYDIRNASGLIPADGGIRELGVFEDVKGIFIGDGGLIVQDGRRLVRWTSTAE